jgi:hypothetical protein
MVGRGSRNHPSTVWANITACYDATVEGRPAPYLGVLDADCMHRAPSACSSAPSGRAHSVNLQASAHLSLFDAGGERTVVGHAALGVLHTTHICAGYNALLGRTSIAGTPLVGVMHFTVPT